MNLCHKFLFYFKINPYNVGIYKIPVKFFFSLDNIYLTYSKDTCSFGSFFFSPNNPIVFLCCRSTFVMIAHAARFQNEAV